METEIFLARLFGFSMITIALPFLVMPDRMKSIIKLVKNTDYILHVGILKVVLGLAVILSYNSWNLSWKLIITLLGWLLFLLGILILYKPSLIVKLVEKIEEKNWFPIKLTGIVLLGCVLIYISFTS